MRVTSQICGRALFTLIKTRSQAQKPAHKDLPTQMTQARPFRLEATYAPVSKRACSRSVPLMILDSWSYFEDSRVKSGLI
ncbi:hypothetical protein CPZ13_09865 [Lacticaseibacillus paracasei]|nr:hypothetical protein DMC16_03930 [Lacticaseibacillus paracasei]AYG22747.1 hypothetical protein CFM84_06125 [Lacticaseibacillus paracasei]OSP85332.1 hypothetical protein B9J76_03865 [Lacticaseibacillus paracasei]PCL23003.1 hypothetical protein CPZ14_09270 [Lacticaseibacillus paracasei]PCL33586.1 hypothetical protein CPZ13_09865 [Lacticaseibacillus paracasei]